jgi:carboxymethylenebutenolidase
VRQVAIDGLEGVYGRPRGKGPFPGMVVLHESFGLNDDMRAIGRRFVRAGYATVVPDLYSGGVRPLCIARLVFDAVRGGDMPQRRIATVRRWLAGRPEVDGERLGVAGFCMGGGFALVAAVRDDYQAAFVAYGEVPGEAAKLEGICPVVASYGGRDFVYGTHGDRLDDHLTELGVPHDVKTYPDSGHSFMSKTFNSWRSPHMVGVPPGSPVKVKLPLWTAAQPVLQVGYNREDAEDSWERMLAFLDEWVAGTRSPSASPSRS